jgi:STE24 endopeptidase
VLNLPFSFYDTFKVEQKYGFNNTTLKLFIVDLIKSTCLMLLIGIPLLYLILYLIMSVTTWWLWVWLVFVIFNLTIMVIYPLFIAPLFNKFSPLEDENLNQRINHLLERCGFKAKGVFVMDGSRRSSHGNAYFTGIGKSKRIVFFDTLIKNLAVDEIEAVLAHELGHFKKKHILRKIIIAFALNLVVLYLLSLLITQPLFYNGLGVNTVNVHNGLILFTILIGLVGVPLKPLSAYFSRKDEFEADSFAAQYKHKDFLISGLVKLYRDNAATLTPDSLYATFYYSHPPATIRIEHLEAQ